MTNKKTGNITHEKEPPANGGSFVMKEAFLYVPIKGKTMKEEYPSLAKIDEFRDLVDWEMRFVWHLKCKSSLIYKAFKRGEFESYSACISEAFRKAYPGFADFPSRILDYENFCSERFPDPILAAMNKMETFEPEYRDRAQRIYDDMFDGYETILAHYKKLMQDPDKIKTADAKAFIDATVDIQKNMPGLIESCENATGIKYRNVKKGEEGTDFFVMASEIGASRNQEKTH